MSVAPKTLAELKVKAPRLIKLAKMQVVARNLKDALNLAHKITSEAKPVDLAKSLALARGVLGHVIDWLTSSKQLKDTYKLFR